jgi:hypothetical protein
MSEFVNLMAPRHSIEQNPEDVMTGNVGHIVIVLTVKR